MIPAYNAGRTIERTIASIVTQSYQHLEIIVINDGATDDTVEKVSRLQHQDPRIQLLSQENRGVAAARNLGVRQARGALLAPIDADDLWLPTYLEVQVSALLRNGNAPFSFAGSFKIDEFDQVFPFIPSSEPAPSDFKSLYERNWIGNGSAAVFRADAVRAAGGYDETMQQIGLWGAEDWKLALTLAHQRAAVSVREALVGYRMTAHSMSRDTDRMTRACIAVLETVRAQFADVSLRQFWDARTNLILSMMPGWSSASRPSQFSYYLALAYLGNPLWFANWEARRYLLGLRKSPGPNERLGHVVNVMLEGRNIFAEAGVGSQTSSWER